MLSRKEQIPQIDRLARINTVDVEKRTAHLVWSTGAQVRRTDWWTGKRFVEELSLDPAHVDLSRLKSGAPLLNSHASYDLRDVIGVVEDASVNGKEAEAYVRFSKREDVQSIFEDVNDGIIRNVSVGYVVRKFEITERENQLPLYRAVDWEPMELSLVPIGADPKAGVRSEGDVSKMYDVELVFINAAESADSLREVEMGKEADVPASSADSKFDAEKVRKDAQESERTRINDITMAARAGGCSDEMLQGFIRDGVSFDLASRKIFESMAARSQANPTRTPIVETVVDETETLREAVSNALIHRHRPSSVKLQENAREYRGMSLIEIGRDLLEKRGVKTRGLDRLEIAKRAFMTTSDFPNILANVAGKSLRAGYESAAQTFRGWARETSVADFKPVSRVQLGDAPTLEVVNESGEFKRGSMQEGKETYQILTYGKILALTRQTIINDDLDAFTRIPELMGRAAADLESDVVYGVLFANAALNDGVALFHATHANLTGSGTAISVSSLDVARGAMRTQKSMELRPINVLPRYLLVPASKETIAQQYTSADFVSAKSSDINPFKGALEVVVEPRLDANSATAWYMLASPSQIDTVEFAYLQGQSGVYMETREGFDTDGMEMKARLDFGAKAIDYRGMYKNPGA